MLECWISETHLAEDLDMEMGVPVTLGEWILEQPRDVGGFYEILFLPLQLRKIAVTKRVPSHNQLFHDLC